MNENLQLIFDENGIIKKFKEDYVPRQSQIEGSDILYQALDEGHNAILEGPCGYGKTFCYLAPVFQNIAESDFNKTAVIVTNGISLQEQLFHKDIPLMAKIFKELYPDQTFKYMMLKGKQNFVCPKKLQDVIADGFDAQNKTNEELKKIVDWSYETSTGDFAELDFVPSFENQSAVACTKQGECTGRKCPNYNNCFYHKYRHLCRQSNIIITNYHMLFSDSQTGGAILPAYDILVWDEAHEAANIYRDFLGYKISANTVKSIRNDISEILNKKKEFKEQYEQALNSAYLVATAEIYFQEIRAGVFKPWEDIKLLEGVELKSSVNLVDAFNITFSALEKLHIHLKNELEAITPEDEYEYEMLPESEKNEINELSVLVQKADNVMEAMGKHLFVLTKYQEESPKEGFAWWIEKDKDKAGSDTGSSSLNYRQVKVGQDLAQNFFDRPNLTTILTSATLSVGGNFDFIKEEIGLGVCQTPIKEYIGESPFNLTEQQLWYLPLDAVDGNSNQEFEEKFVIQIEKIIRACNGGVLCLFTSIKNMNKAYNQLKWENLNCALLKQGMKPRTQLIEEFKKDKNSVLLGTKSFFTGIDVPGDSLRCVTIDKFPFPSPADPVMQKLSKEQNSFFKYFIPMMVIDLKQAVGRGVRSIDDKCVIAVLDNRMSTARYKGRINNSFSYPKTGTRSLSDVEKFLGTVYQDTSNIDTGEYDDDGDIPF